MPQVLTDGLISKLVRSGEPFEAPDGLVRGLRLRRRSPDGPVRWSLYYRRRDDPGARRRYKLGDYAQAASKGLTLAGARKEAGALKGEIHQKSADPQGELKEKRRAKAALRNAPKPTSVAELVLKSLKTLPLRPATRKEWERRAQVEILKAPFAGKAAALLTSDEVDVWLGKIAERSGHSANTARTVLLRCYSWAIERKTLRDTMGGKIVRSPIADVPKPDVEAGLRQSERVLSPEELRSVLLALGEIEAEGIAARIAYAEATRLLLLTGVRRSAVLGLKRSELDGTDSKEPLWRVPAERSKNGKEHKVPLSRQAVDIIGKRLARINKDFLFPQFSVHGHELEKSMTWSSLFVSDLKKRTARILGRTMEPWKIHGFRSALATHGREKLRISGDIVAMLLSHTLPGPSVTRNYMRPELLDEKRAALTAWATWLDRIKGGEEARCADVLLMRAS